ncbi:MAG: RNA polymerase sigma factor [Candidatus Limnocylindrales bacterium]
MTSVPLTVDADGPALLIVRAAAGDAAAFTRIVAAHHADMLRIAQVVCGDPDLAADAAQAAWAIAWRRLASLRDPNRLRPWLMSVSANEARQLVRRRSRMSVREIAIGDPAGPPMEARLVARIDLGNALGRIDPRDRTLLGLHFIGGLDSAAIGREVGMTATNVRSRMSRAVQRLRKELGDD